MLKIKKLKKKGNTFVHNRRKSHTLNFSKKNNPICPGILDY